MTPELVELPSGEVSMRDARRGTQHEVTLREFAISPTPVTRGGFSVLGNTSTVKPHDVPVSSVTWLDAVMWCNAASEAHGLAKAYSLDGEFVDWDVGSTGFRLPTEAEWVFACRAGTTGPNYGPLGDIAWTELDHVDGPQPVGAKLPNAFGLFDMLGNVWEWCWDFADTGRYWDYRVLKGGGWADPPWSVRASTRRGTAPDTTFDDVGFRVVQGAVDSHGSAVIQGWSYADDVARASIRGSLPMGWTPYRPLAKRRH